MDANEQERKLAETQFAHELRSQFEGLAVRAARPWRRRRLAIAAAFAGVAIAAAVGAAALAGAFSADGPQHWPEPPLSAESAYPTNAAGQTYGALRLGLMEPPDLVSVMATNGKAGYYYWKDLGGGERPSTPEEVAAYNERNLRGFDIPVYESDGVTQIGVFRAGGGKSEAKLADGSTITREADADGNIVTTTTHPDGTVTIETKALDGTVVRRSLTAAEAQRLTAESAPTPAQNKEPKSIKPRAWLLQTMSRLAAAAGDPHAKAWWELEFREYLKRIEGAKSPESPYQLQSSVWLVVMHGDFPGGSWRYWLLDPDSHNVVSQGQSDRRFDTSKIPPPQGPIELGKG